MTNAIRRTRLTDYETQKVAVLAAYIDASPHEWPSGLADVALLCHGYLDLQARIAELTAALAQRDAELAEAREWKAKWETCEKWRKAYQEGKVKLYAKGGVIAEAAMTTLPCSESTVDRWFYAEYVHKAVYDRVVAERDAARGAK